ncbi:MAG: type-F conjugative transfer system secretin TraK [Pseudoruegeria sp.]
MKRYLLIIVLILSASSSSAEVFKVKPDGKIRFIASTTGPTRISVKNNRISDVISADSQFQLHHHEATGDLFLKYVGGEERVVEVGYIVTEGGQTIGFEMSPSSRLKEQTILIELQGLPTKSEASTTSATSQSSGFEVSESGDESYAGYLTAIVREIVRDKIGRKSASKYKVGSTVATLRRGKLSARAFSTSAKSGTRPNPQTFYSSKTAAVWVDDISTGGRFWVVTVEAR